MFFKKDTKPWYSKPIMEKLSCSYNTLREYRKDSSDELVTLQERHYHVSKSLFTLKLLYYSRYFFAFIFNTVVFFAALLYLSPPANSEDIISLGLLFVPVGAIFLSSAMGLYLEGLMEKVNVDVDSILQDIDSYALANHGCRTFDDDAY